jgi:hypothetical protein
MSGVRLFTECLGLRLFHLRELLELIGRQLFDVNSGSARELEYQGWIAWLLEIVLPNLFVKFMATRFDHCAVFLLKLLKNFLARHRFAVAQTLQEGLRDVDRACRFGGEEFVLILSECDAEAALETAERLRAMVEAQEIALDGEQTANVTMSLGVATYPGD